MNVKSHQFSSVSNRAAAGQWSPSLLQNAHDLAQDRANTAAWIDYIEILRNLQGLSFDQLHLALDYYRNSRLKSPTLFLTLMNHILTPGMLHNTDDKKKWLVFESLLANAPGAFAGTIRDVAKCGFLGTRISHYPGLLVQPDGIPQILNGDHFSIQSNIRKAEALIATRRPFASAIDDLIAICPIKLHNTPSIRISVVGNSPSLLNEKSGPEIDSADVVVRFNNVSDLNRQQAHTGKRTDIWVMSPSTPITLCPKDTKLVIVSGLHALDRASFYWRQLPSLEKDLSQFPAGIWYELVRCFQAPPSAGTLLVASLESLGHALDVKTYGFTTCSRQLNHLPNHHADQRPRSSRHNWAAEVQWLGNRSP